MSEITQPVPTHQMTVDPTKDSPAAAAAERPTTISQQPVSESADASPRCPAAIRSLGVTWQCFFLSLAYDSSS